MTPLVLPPAMPSLFFLLVFLVQPHHIDPWEFTVVSELFGYCFLDTATMAPVGPDILWLLVSSWDRLAEQPFIHHARHHAG